MCENMQLNVKCFKCDSSLIYGSIDTIKYSIGNNDYRRLKNLNINDLTLLKCSDNSCHDFDGTELLLYNNICIDYIIIMSNGDYMISFEDYTEFHFNNNIVKSYLQKFSIYPSLEDNINQYFERFKKVYNVF